MSRRITLTVRIPLYQALLRRSEEEGRSLSNLIAFLLENSIKEGWRPTDRPKETPVIPGHSRDNGSVIAGQAWFNERQAARLLGIRAEDDQEADQPGEVSL